MCIRDSQHAECCFFRGFSGCYDTVSSGVLCSGDFAYSAYAYALTYVINALYDVSPADHQEVVSLLDEGILRDFANENEYWQDFESDLADTGEQIYDSYLQNNGVSDGRKSYGRMIDLIIALNREGEL